MLPWCDGGSGDNWVDASVSMSLMYRARPEPGSMVGRLRETGEVICQ